MICWCEVSSLMWYFISEEMPVICLLNDHTVRIKNASTGEDILDPWLATRDSVLPLENTNISGNLSGEDNPSLNIYW